MRLAIMEKKKQVRPPGWKQERRLTGRNPRGQADAPLCPVRCAIIAEVMETRAHAYEVLGYHKLAATCRDFGARALKKLEAMRG